ncbi:MAG: hypothetical protein WC488_02260 [Candidatus Micrarchaeia archaeon]
MVYAKSEGKEKEGFLGGGIKRSEDEDYKALSSLWETMRDAILEPKSGKDVDRFDARVTAMLRNPEERRIFQMLEKEMKLAALGKSGLGIRRGESAAFFAYCGSGEPEERVAGLRELQRDVRKSRENIEYLEARVERLGEEELARLAALAVKGAKKSEVEEALGSNASPEAVERVYELIAKQDASSLAARDLYGIEKSEYEKLFGIAAKNEMVAVLILYRRILGDAGFTRAMERIGEGKEGALFAEMHKMDLAAQYFFLSVLAPELVRNGMWSKSVLGMLSDALGKVGELARGLGLSPVRKRMEFLNGARKIVSRFGDFGGVNLGLFSAAFIAKMVK